MTIASTSIRKILLALQQRDLAMRTKLESDGSLFDGYHPEMEAIHRDNANELQTIIDHHGWPNERIAERKGAEAAWLIAQHAIGEPAFMRRCRALLEVVVAAGAVPIWQYAYIDDRIRVFEGQPQRYGTQFELTPDGPIVCEVEEPQTLDQRRDAAGLPPIAERLTSMQKLPRPTPREFNARKKAEAAWRLKVGWRAASDA